MRLLLASLLIAPFALAQQQPAINTTALTGLAAALSGAGLNQLAGLAATIANTTAGAQLLASLTTPNKNFTLLAPSDAAFGKAPKNLSGDDLAVVLSYHVLPGGFPNQSSFATSPNHTVITTLLNDTNTVHLQGNSSQVIVATVQNGTINILNQEKPVTVTNASSFNNFDVLTIDGVLTPPGTIASLLKSGQFSGITQALALANLTSEIENAQGITLFAPTNDALTGALQALGANATNATIVRTVIQNHIVNGTSVYSTEFNNKFTSAAGESLSFALNNGTWTVTSGSGSNFTANVTQADLLVSNGVVHVIDAVLANTASDANAASSAFSSATSAAAASSANGAVGTTPAGAPAATTGAAVALTAAPGFPVRAVLGALGAVVLGACLL